jgi:CheY-like chemotaxis protein
MHHVLVIEDDDLLREGLAEILREEGFGVTAAAEGTQALEILRSEEVSPCFILLDLMMPGMNGWDFLQLSSRHPAYSRIPIAVASAYPFAEKEVHPAIVLRKPFSPASLKEMIGAHCRCPDRRTPAAAPAPGP